MGDDPRLDGYEPGEDIRIELRESYEFWEWLCEGYPLDRYPAVDSLTEALRRAGEEIPRHRKRNQDEDAETVELSEASIEQLADALAERLEDGRED